jgi:cyclase
LVKTVRFRHPTYIGDPINAVRIFNDKEVDELVFLDITATLERRPPPFELIAKIASECFMPFCYGGGIRSLEHVTQLFTLGVEKIALNSTAVENPRFINEVASVAGSQSVVVSIDVKRNLFGRYRVYTRSGTTRTENDPVDYARRMQDSGAGEILLTSIDRDGTRKGFDCQLTAAVSTAVPIPVIASGGAGTLEHFSEVFLAGRADAALAASFSFFGA